MGTIGWTLTNNVCAFTTDADFVSASFITKFSATAGEVREYATSSGTLYQQAISIVLEKKVVKFEIDSPTWNDVLEFDHSLNNARDFYDPDPYYTNINRVYAPGERYGLWDDVSENWIALAGARNVSRLTPKQLTMLSSVVVRTEARSSLTRDGKTYTDYELNVSSFGPLSHTTLFGVYGINYADASASTLERVRLAPGESRTFESTENISPYGFIIDD